MPHTQSSLICCEKCVMGGHVDTVKLPVLSQWLVVHGDGAGAALWLTSCWARAGSVTLSMCPPLAHFLIQTALL